MRRQANANIPDGDCLSPAPLEDRPVLFQTFLGGDRSQKKGATKPATTAASQALLVPPTRLAPHAPTETPHPTVAAHGEVARDERRQRVGAQRPPHGPGSPRPAQSLRHVAVGQGARKSQNDAPHRTCPRRPRGPADRPTFRPSTERRSAIGRDRRLAIPRQGHADVAHPPHAHDALRRPPQGHTRHPLRIGRPCHRSTRRPQQRRGAARQTLPSGRAVWPKGATRQSVRGALHRRPKPAKRHVAAHIPLLFANVHSRLHRPSNLFRPPHRASEASGRPGSCAIAKARTNGGQIRGTDRQRSPAFFGRKGGLGRMGVRAHLSCTPRPHLKP